MLAKDVMTRDVIVVNPDDSVEKAAQLLVENKISGIPVIDNDSHILGIVTEKDLMIKAGELKVPFYITLFDSIIFLENPIRFNNELKKYTASLVKEVMTEDVLTVKEETPVNEIAEIMRRKNINRVPVVKNNKLIGIVTRNDILKSLVKSNG